MCKVDRIPHPIQVCLSTFASAGRSSGLETDTISPFSISLRYTHGWVDVGRSTPTGIGGVLFERAIWVICHDPLSPPGIKVQKTPE